jgi:hypothetical protein
MKGVRIVKIYKNFGQLYRIISRSQEEKNIGCNDTSPSFLREICEEAKSSILEVINEMSENKTGALNTSINKNDQFFGYHRWTICSSSFTTSDMVGRS